MTEGYTLDLVPESWPRIDKKARNGILKAEKHLEVRKGTLAELRVLHWKPSYLPRRLKPNQRVYVATLDGRPVSAVMVEQNNGVVIYGKAGNHKDYRHLQGNSLLIWRLTEEYPGATLDLGGSRQKGISRFKRRFATGFYSYSKPRTLAKRIRYRLRWLGYKLLCPYGVVWWRRGLASCSFHEDCPLMGENWCKL